MAHEPESSRGTQFSRIRAGDREAFDSLFRKEFAGMCGFVAGLVRSDALAEEIVQDVFAALWERRAELRPEGSERAFLYTAARNRALDLLRRERLHLRWTRSRPPSLGGTRRSLTEDRVLLSELELALERALDRMPERRRTIFLLSRESGFTYAEIARLLDISIKTVEAQMGQALRTLREQLSAYR